MKVLQINKFYRPTIGGVETVVKDYSEYLREGHNEVSVLCVAKEASWRTKVEVLDGVTVYRCSSFGTYFSMPVSFSIFYWYAKLLMKNDVVIFHLPFPLGAMLSCVAMGKRVVTVWHSDILKQKWLKLIFEPFVRRLLRVSDVIITTSPQLEQFSEGLKRYRNKCVVVPLAVDVSRIVGGEESGVPEITDECFDFLFFGRLAYYKGISYLLDAINILSLEGLKPRVVIAGDGPLSVEVRSFLKENELANVTFVNRFLTESEKLYLLRRCGCFVFPSVEETEAFGITQLEAMSCSVPVINTTLRTGVPWVSLDQVSGISVVPKSSDAIAEAMRRMLDRAEIDRFGRQALARARQIFDKPLVARHVVDTVTGKIHISRV